MSPRALHGFALGLMVLALAGFGCQRDDAPAAQQQAPSASVSGDSAGAKSSGPCELSGRIDLSLARDVGWMARAKAQFLSKQSVAVERLRAAGIDLEGLAREARFCELALGGNLKSRNVVLSGEFPGDVLERIARAGSDTERADSTVGEVVRANTSWFGRARGELVWADRRDTLERVLANEFEDPELGDHLLAVRMSRELGRPLFASIAEQVRLEDREWDGVVLWTARDGMSSGVRLLTRSEAATTRVLGAWGAMLDGLNQDQRISALLKSTPFSVEGSELGAALRFQGSLDELVALLGRIERKVQKQPSHDHP